MRPGILATVLCGLAAVDRAAGCELCAIYAAEHGRDGGRGGWFTGAAEQFTTFGGLQLGGQGVSNPADQRIESSTTQFILGYRFEERFSLQANIPYIHRSYRRPNGGGIEEGSESGLGDAVLVGKLLLLRKDTENSSFAWSLLGGLKFPTGSTSQLRDETRALSQLVSSGGSTHGSTHSGTVNGVNTASGIHGFNLALGSGSLDGRVGTSVYYRKGRGYFTGAVQYSLNSEGDYGYRFANDLSWDGGAGYYLLAAPGHTLALEAAISGMHKGADTYRDQPVDSSAMTMLYLGPKLNYTWKDRLTAHFGVDFPVSITTSGLQAVPGPRLRAGMTWLLGPGAQQPPGAARTDVSTPPAWTPQSDARFYGGLEYLHWWVKDAPLSVPLVSTGPIATTHHGYVDSDTTILYGAPLAPSIGGNDSQRFPGFSGARLTLGYWLDQKQRFAVEARAFGLQTQTAAFEARSDSNGEPIVNVPLLNNVSYAAGRGVSPSRNEDGLPASLPSDPNRLDGNAGIFTGGVKVTNRLQLWGTDVTQIINFYRDPTWELSGLVGARHLDLSESFDLDFDSTGVTGVYSGRAGAAWDRFHTRDQFWGGALGLRGSYSRGPLSAELTGRVALGVSHQVLEIAGGYFQTRAFGTVYESAPQGIFAQPANAGKTSRDRFAAVPEVQFKIGYAFTPRCRATVAYDFLYYSDVLRAGDQINRELPKGQTFNQGKAAASTTSPARLSKTSDFFAHGLSFGMEFRF